MQSGISNIIFVVFFIIGIVTVIVFSDSEFPVGYLASILITLYFLLLIGKIVLRKKIGNHKGIIYYILCLKKPYSDYSNREFYEHVGFGPIILVIIIFLTSLSYTIWYTVAHLIN